MEAPALCSARGRDGFGLHEEELSQRPRGRVGVVDGRLDALIRGGREKLLFVRETDLDERRRGGRWVAEEDEEERIAVALVEVHGEELAVGRGSGEEVRDERVAGDQREAGHWRRHTGGLCGGRGERKGGRESRGRGGREGEESMGRDV